ncbi:MAG: hypothetical protein ACP5H2_03625, partial [Solirubrobacteraceae bacterium]
MPDHSAVTGLEQRGSAALSEAARDLTLTLSDAGCVAAARHLETAPAAEWALSAPGFHPDFIGMPGEGGLTLWGTLNTLIIEASPRFGDLYPDAYASAAPGHVGGVNPEFRRVDPTVADAVRAFHEICAAHTPEPSAEYMARAAATQARLDAGDIPHDDAAIRAADFMQIRAQAIRRHVGFAPSRVRVGASVSTGSRRQLCRGRSGQRGKGGRPKARGGSARSSASSGDSGDGPSEPPSDAGRRICQRPGCTQPIPEEINGRKVRSDRRTCSDACRVAIHEAKGRAPLTPGVIPVIERSDPYQVFELGRRGLEDLREQARQGCGCGSSLADDFGDCLLCGRHVHGRAAPPIDP